MRKKKNVCKTNTREKKTPILLNDFLFMFVQVEQIRKTFESREKIFYNKNEKIGRISVAEMKNCVFWIFFFSIVTTCSFTLKFFLQFWMKKKKWIISVLKRFTYFSQNKFQYNDSLMKPSVILKTIINLSCERDNHFSVSNENWITIHFVQFLFF